MFVSDCATFDKLFNQKNGMTAVYDEVELEDMVWNQDESGYNYTCPCGDLFFISLEDMLEFDEEIATCPSCSLIIRYVSF